MSASENPAPYCGAFAGGILNGQAQTGGTGGTLPVPSPPTVGFQDNQCSIRTPGLRPTDPVAVSGIRTRGRGCRGRGRLITCEQRCGILSRTPFACTRAASALVTGACASPSADLAQGGIPAVWQRALQPAGAIVQRLRWPPPASVEGARANGCANAPDVAPYTGSAPFPASAPGLIEA